MKLSSYDVTPEYQFTLMQYESFLIEYIPQMGLWLFHTFAKRCDPGVHHGKSQLQYLNFNVPLYNGSSESSYSESYPDLLVSHDELIFLS